MWEKVKPYLEELRSSHEPIILSSDDSIEAKPYTDESALICWYLDHVFQRSVKGVNFLTAMAEVQGMRLPCAVEFVKKNQWETQQKTGKLKRKSNKTKNELFREMLMQSWQNFVFEYVVCDSLFSGAENMKHVKGKLGVNFVMASK